MDFKIPKLIHEPDGRGERNLGLDFERERERERVDQTRPAIMVSPKPKFVSCC